MADDGAKKACGVPEKVQLHGAMLALQFGYAGFHIVSRAALNMGISKVVFPVYRNIVALIVLAPIAYFLEKKYRPTITFKFLLQFFFIALFGITASQGFYMLGLENTSPSFASAIQNSIPAITFIMAVALRIEKVQINRRDGIAKVIGTLVCVGGATVLTLYKGPALFAPAAIVPELPPPLSSVMALGLRTPGGGNWTLGCIYLVCHCLSWSSWLVFQTPVLKKFPARLSLTSFTCFFSVIQFLVIAAFLERDANAWRFHSGGELFSILYSGIVASVIAYTVQIWCIDRGGPVFVAVYQPVQTMIVAITASITMGEQFYLGGIIGAVLIVIGLYLVLWGKSQEQAFTSKESIIVVSSTSHHDGLVPASTAFAAASLTQPLLPSSTPKPISFHK